MQLGKDINRNSYQVKPRIMKINGLESYLLPGKRKIVHCQGKGLIQLSQMIFLIRMEE
jgi:hypothetical protein